jgi:hypothetical protein
VKSDKQAIICNPGEFLNKAMKEDPIIKEVRQYREQHAAEFNYDLQAIYRDLKKKERKSKQNFTVYLPRRSEVTNTADL